VGTPIGRVVPLVGVEHAGRLGLGQQVGQPGGHVHVVVRILVGHRGHLPQVGAAQPQHVLLFLRLGVGDDDDAAVAPRPADQRQADSSVAGGALDDDSVGFEPAGFLGVHDDSPSRPILHGLAGVQELRLAEDLAAGLFGGAAQTNERGPANRAYKAVANVHRSLALLSIVASCRAAGGD
jgi:hypothetical protein